MKIRIKLELDLPEGGPVRRRGISSDVLTRWAGITYLFYKIWEVGIDYMSGEAVDYIVNVLAALIK